MVAEVAVCDCEIVAFPVTTCPLVGSANFGNTGTTGLAKTDADINAIIEKNTRKKVLAKSNFASQFLKEIFSERSDLS
jgi:hypothetical protein